MSRSEVHVDPRVLSILSNALFKLQGSGGRIPADYELWLEPACNQNARIDSSTTELRTIMEDLQDLKNARRALSSLTENLGAAITKRQEEILPAIRDHGLASLPTEILLHVFRQLLNLYDNHFEAARIIIRDMSLVCRHFRDMVLVFTDVWAYLNLDVLRVETVDLFMKRSRREPLSVRFVYSAESRQAIFQALKQKDRWRRLNAEFHADSRRIIKTFPATVFPFIKTLRIFDKSERGRDTDIFSRWVFPCADVIELSGSLPRKNLNHHSISTFIYVSGNDDVDTHGLFLERLTRFLRPVTGLVVLHLDVSYILESLEMEDEDVEFDVELPNLREFYISNWGPEYPMQLSRYACIIRAFDMPNVKEVSVSLAFHQVETLQLSYWLYLAFPELSIRESVTRFTFNVMRVTSELLDDTPEDMRATSKLLDDASEGMREISELLDDTSEDTRLRLSMTDIFDCFWNLQALTLNSHDHNVWFSYGSRPLLSDLRNLQSFSINNCDASWHHSNCIIEHLKASRGANLQEIKFISKSKAAFDISNSKSRQFYPDATIEVSSE